jgi:hypothetical protein
MGRKASNKPKADHQLPVSKETYDITTKLKSRLPYSPTYDDMQQEFIRCYTIVHRIDLDGGNKNG